MDDVPGTLWCMEAQMDAVTVVEILLLILRVLSAGMAG
jgi:hypothetical protein